MSAHHDEEVAPPVRVPPEVAEHENEAAARAAGREVQVLEDVDARESRRGTVSAEDESDIASTDGHTKRVKAEEVADREAEPPEVPDDEVDIASADSMAASDPPSFTPAIAGARKKK